MRKSKVVAKLGAKKFVRMVSMGHVIPAYIKMAKEFGYDGIWLDLEHRAMTDREVQLLLAYAHAIDIDIMVRAPTLEKTKLYRYLEDGAAGFMIPHCSTPEKAKMIVDAMKFPPLGDRGMDGAGFDSGFAFDDLDSYPQEANNETFLVCQIETIEAVNNADAIAQVEGVDVLFVGPGDLGLRLAVEDTDMTLDDAIDVVRATCKKHGKAWGITAGSPEQLAERVELGASLVPWGSEYGALRSGLTQAQNELDTLSGQHTYMT